MDPSIISWQENACLRFFILGQCVMLFINSLPRGRDSVFPSAFPPSPSKCIFGIVSSCSQTPKPLNLGTADPSNPNREPIHHQLSEQGQASPGILGII